MRAHRHKRVLGHQFRPPGKFGDRVYVVLPAFAVQSAFDVNTAIGGVVKGVAQHAVMIGSSAPIARRVQGLRVQPFCSKLAISALS